MSEKSRAECGWAACSSAFEGGPMFRYEPSSWWVSANYIHLTFIKEIHISLLSQNLLWAKVGRSLSMNLFKGCVTSFEEFE